MSSEYNLLIVGAGVLGKIVGTRWLERHRSAEVCAVTTTDKTHPELSRLGFKPFTSAELYGVQPVEKYPYIVFCAPPGGSTGNSYVNSVRLCSELWSGSGAFVFTSSIGVYGENNGATVHENSDFKSTVRAKQLLECERLVQSVGGTAIRLAGLYSVSRGPHAYYFRHGKVNGSKMDILNMIHYDDAAAAVVSVFESSSKASLKSEVFHISDGHPLSKFDICKSASHLFGGEKMFPTFIQRENESSSSSEVSPSGKILDLRKSSELLPAFRLQHRSFVSSMEKVKQ